MNFQDIQLEITQREKRKKTIVMSVILLLSIACFFMPYLKNITTTVAVEAMKASSTPDVFSHVASYTPLKLMSISAASGSQLFALAFFILPTVFIVLSALVLLANFKGKNKAASMLGVLSFLLYIVGIYKMYDQQFVASLLGTNGIAPQLQNGLLFSMLLSLAAIVFPIWLDNEREEKKSTRYIPAVIAFSSLIFIFTPAIGFSVIKGKANIGLFDMLNPGNFTELFNSAWNLGKWAGPSQTYGILLLIPTALLVIAGIMMLTKSNNKSKWITTSLLGLLALACYITFMVLVSKYTRPALHNITFFAGRTTFGFGTNVLMGMLVSIMTILFPFYNWCKKFDGDHSFNVINTVILCAIGFATLYPFWYVLVCSISETSAVTTGKVFFWPIGFELSAYKKVLEQKIIWSSYGNTIFYAFVGTAVSLVLTILGAYPLSKRRLRGRKFFTMIMLITMWFGAGMMPFYLNLRDMGMLTDGFTMLFKAIPVIYDTRWTMIFAFAVSAFNTVLIRTYFENVSDSLEESAKIDGASDWKVLMQIYLPLSVPALMTIGLYYFVDRWNGWFWASIIISDESKQPLQLYLRKLVVQMTVSSEFGATVDNPTLSDETIIYSTIIIAAGPMLVLYPFVQKFFVKGIMLGAVKG